MKGALPPSSRLIFLMVCDDCSISRRPISVEPVKLILRTASLDVSSPPMAEAEPVTMLNRPGGRPASSASTASASADSGVWLAGFSTTAQPAARAGPTLRVIMAAGKFQGVMAPTTPTGWRSVTSRLEASWLGMTSP